MATLTKKSTGTKNNYRVVNFDEIEFATRGGGGGRGISPEVQNLIDRLSGLKIGQGVELAEDMVIERDVKGSTVYTYKGALTVQRWADRNGKRIIARRDVNGEMFVFRVDPEKFPKRQKKTKE